MQATNDVLVIGVGQSTVGEHWKTSLRVLALEAISKARAEAGGIRPQALYVANMLAPILSGQTQLGAMVADFAGLLGIETSNIEAGGASGGLALRQGFMAVASGMTDVALVVGVEKFSEKPAAEVEAALATATDSDFEAIQGITPLAQGALLMRRYMYEYDIPEHGLSGFSINAHANAVHNPNAMFRRAISTEAYQRAGKVADPLNMFDAAPNADGAAAIMLARADVLPTELPFPRVRLASSAVSSTAVALHDQKDPLAFQACIDSSSRALDHAGIQTEMVDFFELHDQFSIYAALALEAAGFCKRGEGWKLADSGAIQLNGRIPICTFGGSKGRGDTGGANGLYQAVEAILQLQHRAGKNQVPDARIGMIQSISNVAATSVTHIFSRE